MNKQKSLINDLMGKIIEAKCPRKEPDTYIAGFEDGKNVALAILNKEYKKL